MFAVIFDVYPKPERYDDYLALAGTLRPDLEGIDGFLSVERFATRGRPGWILSLSLWRDEAALVRWRTHGRHRQAQERGRREIFQDYRLRPSHCWKSSLRREHGSTSPRSREWG
jgi:heme-degrading monooxygenase HmoA